MKLNFTFTRIPDIHFGAGKIDTLHDLIRRFGSSIILLTGKSSFKDTENFEQLMNHLKKSSIHYTIYEISGEPTPSDINMICKNYVENKVDVVVAIGGGSVLDAGKAVSAMVGKTEPVEDFLEGVGTKTTDGTKIPFIAVPTTSGTGSEATKNAVITQIGKDGFKKSMRHDNYVPDLALIDPELTLGCPSHITAACGMDAFTQLLESYVSTKASPMTDALAYSGIKLIKDNLTMAASGGAGDIDIRTAMSYSALISGITLANAGLGIVHGLASPMGSYFEIPHGVVCGTLIGIATRINIDLLRKSYETNIQALKKYENIGRLLSNGNCKESDDCVDYLIEKIDEWIDFLKIPRLSSYGFQENDIQKIIDGTGQKNNPVKLSNEDIRRILYERL